MLQNTSLHNTILRKATLTAISSAIVLGLVSSSLYKTIGSASAAEPNEIQAQTSSAISYDVRVVSDLSGATSPEKRLSSTIEITVSNSGNKKEDFPLRFKLPKAMQVLSYQIDQDSEQKLKAGVFAEREISLKVKDIPAQGQRLVKLNVAHLIGANETSLELPISLIKAAKSSSIQATTVASACPALDTQLLTLPVENGTNACRYFLNPAILNTAERLALNWSVQVQDRLGESKRSLARVELAMPIGKPEAPPLASTKPAMANMPYKADTRANSSPIQVSVTGSSIRTRENPAPLVKSVAPITMTKDAETAVNYYPHVTQTQNTAKYQQYNENPWKRVAEEPVSTFSADVDTASYANVRRFLQQGSLPAPDAVRAEELINYFGYDYALPAANAKHPFSVRTDLATSPWSKDRYLLRVAIKGKDLAKETLPPANLVFLVDVSGSMSPADRLPLVKSALKLLTTQLREQDHVSLVTYASGSRVVLPPTSGAEKSKIMMAIDQLVAGGGTNGETGLRLAYRQAYAGMIERGINRVLLATDGDLNIGVTDPATLKAMVENERKAGISLSTLGVGNDNFNDALMKKLADNGDGSYHYLDTLQEAHKVLVNEYTSTLAPIAQDLKLQVEFNPENVAEYRLIGYELRALTREQFNDDKVDAGDIGSGHTVTALYEIVPAGSKGNVDPLRYSKEQNKDITKTDAAKNGAHQKELALLKLRYKQPGESKSQLIEIAIDKPSANKPAIEIAQADTEFRFATAVAAWAQWLRGSSLIGDFSEKDILSLARSARGEDRFGHRAEFIRLVELASSMKPHPESERISRR